MTTLNHVKAESGLLHYGLQGIDDLYARVWGDSIHFGYYRDDFESIESACLEAKRIMAEAAAVGTGMTVLEVASGWGATARFLARDWGVRVTATNLEATQLKTARLLTGLLGLGRLVSHIPADFQDLSFRRPLSTSGGARKPSSMPMTKIGFWPKPIAF